MGEKNFFSSRTYKEIGCIKSMRLVGPVPRSSETGQGEFSRGGGGGAGVEDRLV